MQNRLLLSSGATSEKLYVEDVFSTWLYTGNGGTQTITNGIDLAGKGGMVWIKPRNTASNHRLFDTARGALNELVSNSTSAQNNNAASLTSFGSAGFSLGSNLDVNSSSDIHASWTFREAPKFFDVVTYTGDGATSRDIAHSLGIKPGVVIIKRTVNTSDWAVWHRGDGTTAFNFGSLNRTAAVPSSTTYSGLTSSTTFRVGDANQISANTGSFNVNGATYVAYLFAHDATSDGIIQCGSFTTDGSGNASVNLGWEPQWLLVKQSSASGSWFIVDNLRAMPVNGNDSVLYADQATAETISNDLFDPTATGFNIKTFGASTTNIYIAIRRGPMKTPTSGTSVFAPVAYTSNNVDRRLVNTGIVTDAAFARVRDQTSSGSFYVADRLRGDAFLATASTAAEATDADSYMTLTLGYGNSFSAMNGFGVGNDPTRLLNYLTNTEIAYAFRRAPSFFDEVCYTGTGVDRTVSHNLGVVPELMIVKRRNDVENWYVYHAALGATQRLKLNLTDATQTALFPWNNTAPTSTVFSLAASVTGNGTGSTYVAYLFATCPGVSKVGSYTGNGSSQTINCGFSGGARFVMIKRTDAAGDWNIWDTARGISTSNDPILRFNTTTSEVTGFNPIDPDSSGFIVNQENVNINVTGATYIYLAVA